MTSAHVLIVDDDQALLEALPEALRLRIDDLETDTSDSAREALRRIAEVDYDAFVIDIKMPDMDGLELLSEVKKVRPDTPTILITGHGDHELAVDALRLGAYDYVTKPINREYFVSCLNRAIECQRLARNVETKRLELLEHTRELEACVQERTVELREALHREQLACRKLHETHQRLEELSQQRDMFVSMIAHDLATPLTSIRGYAEMMGRGSLGPEQQERARELIVSETDRLARLAFDLTSAAEVIAGHKAAKDWVAIPGAIFTDPEIAVVGLTAGTSTLDATIDEVESALLSFSKISSKRMREFPGNHKISSASRPKATH